MATASATDSVLLSDITECSICLETWKDPRFLPTCNHTFCLKCLKTFVLKLNEDREDTRCPVCRKEFAIPEGGLDLLPKNFMHQQLLDARRVVGVKTASSGHEPNEEILVCDLCTFNITASGYCIECDQNICTTCTMSHSRARGTRHHKVVELGDKKNPQLIRKLRSSYCQQHREEQVKLYCNECQKSLCALCHALEHVGHKCCTINDGMQGFVDKIKGCQMSVEGGIAKTEGHLGQITKNRNEFLEVVSDKENKLQKKEEEIIKLIKAEHAQLWNELQQIKEKRLKEINMNEEEIETELLALKGFMKTSKELINNGSASDICRSSNDLLTQADALVKSQTKSAITCSLDHIDLSFISAMKPDVNGCEIRLVGLIHYTGITDVDNANSSGENQKAVTLDHLLTSLDTKVKEKDTKISSLQNDVKEKDTKIAKQEKQAKEKDTKIASLQKDVEEKDKMVSSLEKDAKEKDTKIARLEKDAKEKDTKIVSLEKHVKKKATKIVSRNTQFEKVEEKYRKVNEAIEPVRSTLFLAKSTVVRVIPGDGKGDVYGIAVLGSQLFIAREVALSIEVYDTDNITATPHMLKISDEIFDSPRLAACSHYNCLYVGPWNHQESVMYRVELSNSSVSSWKTRKWLKYNGELSVTNDNTLLVTGYWEQLIREYTTHGELIREIRIDSSIDHPGHCIQLSDGNYVISHSGSTKHRVCMVDTSGQIIKSYGGSRGSGVDQLNGPYHLSVDKYDNVLVADRSNKRIQLLSPTLTLLGTVQIPGHELKYPVALHFDNIKDRLYVNRDSDVLVVEFSIAQ